MKYYGKGLLHCPTCQHFQFHEPVGTAKYDKSYKEKYDCYEVTELGREINAYRWDFVLENHLAGSTRLLDWGCGNGSFVRMAPPGWTVRCYDINPHSGCSDNPELAEEAWAVVTMWDVLEHMVDPYGFIKNLKTDVLCLTVPDVAGVRGGIESWKHYRPDEHQHYFSVSSLARMLSRAGFYITDLDRSEAIMRDWQSPDSLVTVCAKRQK